MKQTETTSGEFATKVIDRLCGMMAEAERLRKRIAAYDRAPLWRRALMGGMVYRAVLEYWYYSALDDYIQGDLRLRE